MGRIASLTALVLVIAAPILAGQPHDEANDPRGVTADRPSLDSFQAP